MWPSWSFSSLTTTSFNKLHSLMLNFVRSPRHGAVNNVTRFNKPLHLYTSRWDRFPKDAILIDGTKLIKLSFLHTSKVSKLSKM
uniref:Uncharacterized protein n=1 Tax=Rhizophora mucronata TaxID=61149 RepID=A0A2P2MMI1_RHIMU